MVGALTAVMESHASPCLCLDALPSANMSLKSGGDLALQRNSLKRKQHVVVRGPTASASASASLELGLGLGSSFLHSWHDSRSSAKSLTPPILMNNKSSSRRQQRKNRRLVVVNELGGQYEEGFADVKEQMLNYFTYKATRTVLHQLYEMNPPQYTWLYHFVAENKPTDGKRFIRVLAKERQELAERVMITRLHLYGKWIKKCDHAQIYKEISDENLELMRERLMETVVWPSDDTNTEKIG